MFRPLMLRLGISLPLPVHEAAYGGSSLLGMADTHRVDVGLVIRMIAFRSGGNPNGNRSMEIKQN
jgi:hypothetical protein